MVLHFVWFKKMTTLNVNTNTKFVKKTKHEVRSVIATRVQFPVVSSKRN